MSPAMYDPFYGVRAGHAMLDAMAAAVGEEDPETAGMRYEVWSVGDTSGEPVSIVGHATTESAAVYAAKEWSKEYGERCIVRMVQTETVYDTGENK